MKRRYLLPCGMAGLMLATLTAGARGAPGAVASALLRGVAISSPASGDSLLLRIQGDYAFQAEQTAPDKLSLNLRGVRADSVAAEGRWGSGVVSGYRLENFQDGSGTPGLRVELTLRHPQSFRVERDSAGLQVVFAPPTAPKADAAVKAPAAPLAPVAARGPVAVHGVSIQAGENGQTLVNIATSRPGPYRVFELSNPERLVVDFDGACPDLRRRSFRSNAPHVQEVRVAQFQAKDPEVVRVVADLVGHPQYDVHRVAGGVCIVLSSPRKGSAGSTAPVVAAPTAAPRPAAVPAAVAAASPNYQKVLPNTSGPAVAAAPRAADPVANPDLNKSLAAAHTMSATTMNFSPDAQAPAQAAGSMSQQSNSGEKPEYSGEPISVNLKDVDLKDFFRLIHEISGLNIIVDKDVTGTITMVLTDVPWDQALDIVLKDNGLGKVLEGNVLRIAKVSTLTAEQAASTKLAEARLEGQPLVTRFVAVNYAKASAIASMLKGWAGGGALTKRGNVLVDDRTNTLIISDIATQIPVIEGIVKKLDTKTKQVAIEARVESVDHTFLRTLASALSIAEFNRSGSTTQAGVSGAGSSATTSAANFPKSAVTVPDQTLTGFGVYAISNVGARYIINGMLAAEEDKGLAQTISKPSIVTQNNVAGTVTQGTQIPIQTTINNTISIQYVQASLTLNVTPQVTSDGNIFMVIAVQNSAPGQVLTSAGPSIQTQSATTQVMVPDGGTVIFGGVTVATKKNSSSYVPLLGRIPVLGNLFKSSNASTEDTELLFFVTPKILPG
jgi:type IV pilus assembly protein PilQ